MTQEDPRITILKAVYTKMMQKQRDEVLKRYNAHYANHMTLEEYCNRPIKHGWYTHKPPREVLK